MEVDVRANVIRHRAVEGGEFVFVPQLIVRSDAKGLTREAYSNHKHTPLDALLLIWTVGC